MRYCSFQFDDIPGESGYHINRRQVSDLFPYYVPSLGINIQGPRYFTDRAGYEMLFVCLTLRGSGAVTSGGQCRLLRPGDLFVLNCTEPHRYESRSGRWEFLWIHIKGYGAREFFDRFCPEGLFVRHPSDTAPIHTLYERLIPLVEAPTAENNLEASELLGSFLHRLAGYTITKEAPPLPDTLERTLTYIRDHISDELTVEALAAAENYSVSYFSHLFTRKLGVSPYRYILRLRLHNGATMLLSTDRSIEEIASVCHFSDSSRFIAHFRRLYGVTPARYRREARLGRGDVP